MHARSLPRRLAALPLLLSLLLVVACGGGGAGREPFVADPPPPPPGGGGGGGGGTPTPPPTGPQAPVWEPDAFVLQRTALFGSFPSGLVLHGETLFTTDADQIEASGALVLPLDIATSVPAPSTRFAPVRVMIHDLVQSDGFPADPSNPIAFGFYLNDFVLVADDLGFVLVNAGGSDSSPTLSNVVAFDPSQGVIRQVVDLARHFTPPGPMQDSAGMAVPPHGFVQSGAEALAFVPTGPARGRLYVAMTNFLIQAPSFGTTKLPGTVQVLDVDLAAASPVRGFFPTRVTQGFNPVEITPIAAEPALLLPGEIRLLVTVAGAAAFDPSFNLVPTTDASVEAWRGGDGAFLGRFTLGKVGLAATRPALGRDRSGHRVGFFPSAVTGEIYLLRLDGLYAAQVDASRLAVLRGPDNGIPIATATPGGPGANVSAAALSPDGRTLVVAGFGDLFTTPPTPGRVLLLGLPEDLVSGGGYGIDFVPGTSTFASAPGRAMGPIVLRPDEERPDLFVSVSGRIDPTSFLGVGPASIGTLETFGVLR